MWFPFGHVPAGELQNDSVACLSTIFLVASLQVPRRNVKMISAVCDSAGSRGKFLNAAIHRYS